MGTAVLRPQDFWTDRFRLPPPAFYSRKTHHPSRNDSSNPRHHRKLSLPRPERPGHRRKSPSQSPSPPPSPQPQQREVHLLPKFPRRSASADELRTDFNKLGSPPHVSGRVLISKRGQSLDTLDATRMHRDMNNEARNGLVKKKYLYEDDVYAGLAFFASPSPSSLPLPSFFNHNHHHHHNNNNNVSRINASSKTDEFHHHDSATRDLRRLLRLE